MSRNKMVQSLMSAPIEALQVRTKRDLERFKIYERDAAGVEVFWAPFDYVNAEASLCIVGVTPGPTQASKSYIGLRGAIEYGEDQDAVLARVKCEASFRGGVMETNLKSLLEHSGVAEKAGVEDVDSLWTQEAHKVHFTSTLRFPVYFGGEPYNNNIDSLTHPALRQMIDNFLVTELRQLPSKAIVVSLGKEAPRIVEYAAGKAKISKDRLFAIPHPSKSANGSVRRYLSEERYQGKRSCRCILCDPTRLPSSWTIKQQYWDAHRRTHSG